jgi:membrane protein
LEPLHLKIEKSLLALTVREFIADNCLRLSAALAFYSIFSMAPLLLISISVAGAFLGEDAVRGELDQQLEASLGKSGASVVREMLVHAS